MSASEYQYHEIIISTYDNCCWSSIVIDGVKREARSKTFYDIVYLAGEAASYDGDKQTTELQRVAEGIAYIFGWRISAVRIIACNNGDICERLFIIIDPRKFKAGE